MSRRPLLSLRNLVLALTFGVSLAAAPAVTNAGAELYDVRIANSSDAEFFFDYYKPTGSGYSLIGTKYHYLNRILPQSGGGVLYEFAAEATPADNPLEENVEHLIIVYRKNPYPNSPTHIETYTQNSGS